MCMLIHFTLLGKMQAKHGDEVVPIISQTMDLLEVGDTQSLANSLHEFLEYKNAYNGSMRWRTNTRIH
jgi:hypothetical protein